MAQNDVAAAKWLKKAAEQGDTIAQANLGQMHFEGRGDEPNDVEALYWFRKAAEQGHPQARLKILQMMSTGRGLAHAKSGEE